MSQDPPQPVDRSLDRMDDTLCRIDETLTSIAESLKVLAKVAEASATPIVLPTFETTPPPAAVYREVADEALTRVRARPLGIYRPSHVPDTEQSVKALAHAHRVGHQPEHPVAVYSHPRGVTNPVWKAYCLDPECPAFIATHRDVVPNAQRVEWYQQGQWRRYWSLNAEAAEVFLREKGEERERHVCVTCKGSGRGMNLGGGPDACRVCRGTGFKVAAPYPLDPHDPKAHCRHPNCKDTNWGGHDRLHGRGDDCPPDDDPAGLWSAGGTSAKFHGWVALGDQWDRDHYLPTGREKEPTDG